MNEITRRHLEYKILSVSRTDSTDNDTFTGRVMSGGVRGPGRTLASTPRGRGAWRVRTSAGSRTTSTGAATPPLGALVHASALYRLSSRAPARAARRPPKHHEYRLRASRVRLQCTRSNFLNSAYRPADTTHKTQRQSLSLRAIFPRRSTCRFDDHSVGAMPHKACHPF